MRLAVLSDIHGNRHALDAVLEDVHEQRVDAVLHLGDYLSGPFDFRGVADRLMAMGGPQVRGNHDRFISEGRADDWRIDAMVRDGLSAEQHAWLAAVPDTAVFADEVFLCHGTPRSDNTLWTDGTADDGRMFQRSRETIEAEARGFDYPVLLYGHSHIVRTLRLADGRLLVNPGSVGLPMLLGSRDARYAVIEKGRRGWSVGFRAVPYDHEAAAAFAEERGEPRWAEAIRTGWLTSRDL